MYRPRQLVGKRAVYHVILQKLFGDEALDGFGIELVAGRETAFFFRAVRLLNQLSGQIQADALHIG